MISGVVFDMDETLYDEIEYCKSGFRAVAKAATEAAGSVHEEEFYNALWRQFTGGNHTTTFNAALEQLKIAYDDRFIENMVRTYRQHFPSIKLPADSETVLRTLYTKYMMALLTDGYLPAQRLKVQALGIKKYFRCIVYTEELGREYWKPSPIGFEKILEALNVEGKNCVYVGDNAAKDFVAPNKLDFKTIQVVRQNAIHHNEPTGENAKPEYVIKSLSKLPALLREI